MLVIMRTIVIFTASVRKKEENLDETHDTILVETVSVSKAASAVFCPKCGVKWRRLNDSDLQREDVCDNDKDVMMKMMKMLMIWMIML